MHTQIPDNGNTGHDASTPPAAHYGIEILRPKRRTWRRWRRIVQSPYSLLRTLQYEAIDGLQLRGRVLDIGGQLKSDYRKLLRLEGTLEVVNIDPRAEPTFLHDLNEPLPLPDCSYDHVISLNTFEHIYNDQLALGEAIRVLKVGGSFHILVPFCYRVHASPSDYHRHTAFWWIHQLAGLGVRRDQLQVEPLAWDQRATGYSFVRAGGLAASIILARGLFSYGPHVRHALAVALRRKNGKELSLADRVRAQYENAGTYPVGYYIKGTK